MPHTFNLRFILDLLLACVSRLPYPVDLVVLGGMWVGGGRVQLLPVHFPKEKDVDQLVITGEVIFGELVGAIGK